MTQINNRLKTLEQTQVKNSADSEFTMTDFLRDKVSLIESLLYEKRIIDRETAEAFWAVDQRWLRQQKQKREK